MDQYHDTGHRLRIHDKRQRAQDSDSVDAAVRQFMEPRYPVTLSSLTKMQQKLEALERELASVKLENEMLKNHNARLEKLGLETVDKLRAKKLENARLQACVSALLPWANGCTTSSPRRNNAVRDAQDILSNTIVRHSGPDSETTNKEKL